MALAHLPGPWYFSAPMRTYPNLTVLDHPLIRHKLALLRDKRTPTKDFRDLVGEIAMLMAYEVTKDLTTEPVPLETPLEAMTGEKVAGKKLTLVPVLRAGLGMVEGILRLIPSARVGHIGTYRDHETLQPVSYYFKTPSAREQRSFFVLDPMLATGGSAVDACTKLKEVGARAVRFLCIVAAPAVCAPEIQSAPTAGRGGGSEMDERRDSLPEFFLGVVDASKSMAPRDALVEPARLPLPRVAASRRLSAPNG